MGTPIMPFDTDAYLADTTNLSTAAHGAYLLILMAMWRSPQGRIQNNRTTLAEAAQTTADKWDRYLARKILPLLSVIEPDGGTQPEATSESDGDTRGWITQKRLAVEHAKARNKRWDSRLEYHGPSDSKLGIDSVIEDSDSQQAEKKKEDSESYLTLTGGDEFVDNKRRCRLPKTWVLPEPWRHWARQQGLRDVDIATYADGFANHWWATGKPMLDWFAAWRKWVGNEIKWNVRRQMRSRDPERPGGIFRLAAKMNGVNEDADDETWWRQWATEQTKTTEQ